MTATSPARIGIVTDENWPELTDSDSRLAEALDARGHSVEPVIWHDDSIEWEAFDLLVVRSCYQYYTAPEAFREWLETVEADGPPLVNPVSVIRWNMHKFYLRELDEAGVPVLETAFIESGTDTQLADILEERGWESAVVKPAIGTSSTGAWRTTRESAAADQSRFESDLADGDRLVQAFAPEIADGERSLVFIDGTFSHAWRSIPAEGEFRSHSNYGGHSEVYDPPASIVDQAGAVLDTARELTAQTDSPVAYARVDGVERDGRFVLMELELVEPYLGLGRDDEAADRLANAVLERLLET